MMKMDASGGFLSLQCTDFLLCSQQEAARLGGRSLVWMGEVGALFSCSYAATHSVDPLQALYEGSGI